MKLEKKHYVIIAVVVAIIAVWYFFLRKKKVESNYSESLRTLDNNLPMIGSDSGYAGEFGSFGNESNWLGNAQYYDCHKACMKAGNATSTCDKKCGRGTKGAEAMTIKSSTRVAA